MFALAHKFLHVVPEKKKKKKAKLRADGSWEKHPTKWPFIEG